MKRFKKIIEPAFILGSTIITLISALWCTIANANNHASLNCAIGIFLASISFVFLQILVAVTISNEILEDMNANNQTVGIVPPSNHNLVQAELIKLLQDSHDNISKIRIICYGTSGYSSLFNSIDDYPAIQWEIMVCSPEAIYQSSEHDKKAIDDMISAFSKLTNVKISRAKNLPTLRSCIVYDCSKKPIWSCLQTYSYRKCEKNILLPSAFYNNSYALVGRRDNPFLLDNNVRIIDNEYNRLSK